MLRRILAILILLIAIGLLVVGLLIYFVNPDRIVPVIQKQLHLHTGYQTTIDRPITWTLYPHFGIQIKKINLKHPQEDHPTVILQDVKIAMPFHTVWQIKKKLRAQLFITEMQVKDLHLQHARIKLHWNDGVVNLKIKNAFLCDGLMSGFIQAKTVANTPTWRARLNFQNIQFKSFLEGIYGKEAHIKFSGHGQITTHFTSVGKKFEELAETLSGTTTFSMQNGTLEGIDLNYFVKTADALINKKPFIPESKDHTKFTNLTGTIKINNGIGKMDNLFLSSTDLESKGVGEIDLMHQRLDLELSLLPHLSKPLAFSIPVDVQGTFKKPHVILNINKLEKIIFLSEADRFKNKIPANDKIVAFARNFLKNL